MRKYVLLSAVLVLMSSNARADGVTTNDCCNEECTCHWSYNADSKTIRVFGSGKVQDYERVLDEYGRCCMTGAPWKDLHLEAENLMIEDGITEVGGGAFANMEALKYASVSEDVTKIGNVAFHGSGLERIDLPEHLQSLGSFVFAVTDLKSVVIPEGITRIERAAFIDTDMTSVVIPASVTYINDEAFAESGNDNRTPLQTLYCAGGEQFKRCQELLKPVTTQVIHYEKSGNDYLVYDDKGNVVGKYASAMNLNKGVATETYKYDSAGHLVGIFDGNGQRTWGKKIYTVEEAMEATKDGDKFHVYLTYK